MTVPYIPAQRGTGPVTVDWRAHAACRQADPRLFFPAGAAQAGGAKRICAGCPVRGMCLDWALTTGRRAGVWGGLAEDERLALSRSAGRRPGRR